MQKLQHSRAVVKVADKRLVSPNTSIASVIRQAMPVVDTPLGPFRVPPGFPFPIPFRRIRRQPGEIRKEEDIGDGEKPAGKDVIIKNPPQPESGTVSVQLI